MTISPSSYFSLPPVVANARMVDGQLVVEKGDKRIVFNKDKPILLPERSAEIRTAIATDLGRNQFNPCTVTIGPSGYSDVSAFVKNGELATGAYEAACEDALKQFTQAFNRLLAERGLTYPIVITHGASDVGVDRAARNSATALELRQFGFNQPDWMFYVPDDKVPVYVASDKDDYHHKFAAHTMILLLLGGRNDAAYHDRLNVQQYRNLVLPCPIMPFLMDKASPAWDVQHDLERLKSDPFEWANKVPILDASLAHLRSSPMPEVQKILADEKSPEAFSRLIELLASLAVKHVEERFAAHGQIALSNHVISAKVT